MKQSPYDKAATNLKKIRKFQDLRKQGLATSDEESEAFELAKQTAELFTDDILQRKAKKLAAVTVWTNVTPGPYLSASERKELNEWIELIEEFIDGRKVKTDISNDKTHIKSVVDGEDQHIFITEKGSKEHAHIIVDGGTGELRIDPKDQDPGELIDNVETKLTLKNGDVVRATKSRLDFVSDDLPKPDVRVYTSTKDGYFSLEIYNSGEEDLENFKIEISWAEPGKEPIRVLDQYFEEHDNIMTGRPKPLNLLKVGQRVYSQVPRITNDGLKVEVLCKGIKSGLDFEKTFHLDTPENYEN